MAYAARRRKPSGGGVSSRQPFFKRTTKHSAQAISLHQPSLHTGNAAVRRCPYLNFFCAPILPTPCAAQRHRASVERRQNITKTVPFSPLENKIETDKPHAPFFLKGATPLCGVAPSEGRYYVYPFFCRKITTSLAFKCNHSFALFSLLHFYLLPLVLIISCMLNPYQSLPVGR